MDTTWDIVKTDRETFATYLATLSDDEWAAGSLCDEWSNKAVACHLLVTTTKSKGQIFGSFLKAGFNLDKMSAKYIAEMDSMSTDEVLQQTRDGAASQNTPPGLKPLGVLAEVLIHSSDVARSVGRPLDVPPLHYMVGLDYMKNVGPVFKAKQRISGLKLQATDVDWSTGDGPLVEGPASSLLLAMTGRSVAFADLTGDGVATMKDR